MKGVDFRKKSCYKSGMKKFLVNFNLILGLVFGALGGNFGRAEIVFAEGDLTVVESEEEADLPGMYL